MRNKIIQEDLDFILQSVGDWGKFLGRRIVVSGANGFLPAYLVETLLCLNEQGGGKQIEVVGIVRNLERARKRFAAYDGRKDLCLVAHDITRSISLDGRVDMILHAASQASPKYFGTDPVGTLNANVFGTRNLLELAREKRSTEFLFFSSGEVYGEVDETRMPIKEDSYGYIDPMNVRSCYAESKRMGETMCVAWSHQHGVPVKIVRPFHTYGPGMRLDDGRVFADFVANVVKGQDIVMKSDGNAIRAFCYAADATIGILDVVRKGANREAYNIGNDKEEISILELANVLANLFPDRPLKIIHKATPSGNQYLQSKINRACPDISKARALGWEPRYSVEEGFRRTVKSFLV